MKALLDTYPEGVKKKIGKGQLPLHIALSNKCGLDVVKAVLGAHPEGAKEKNNDGYLPLYIALTENCEVAVAKALLPRCGVLGRLGGMISGCRNAANSPIFSNDVFMSGIVLSFPIKKDEAIDFILISPLVVDATAANKTIARPSRSSIKSCLCLLHNNSTGKLFFT